MGSEEMVAALRRLARRPQAPPPAVSLTPGCPFGAVLQERIKDLEGQLAEVKARINGLIFLVLGAVILQVVVKLLG